MFSGYWQLPNTHSHPFTSIHTCRGAVPMVCHGLMGCQLGILLPTGGWRLVIRRDLVHHIRGPDEHLHGQAMEGGQALEGKVGRGGEVTLPNHHLTLP